MTAVDSPAATGARLEVRGVSKAFGGVVALNAAELTVEPGEIGGLIGPNGSGKTTLINAISGMIDPDAGETLLDGEPLPVGRPADVAARGVARTFQHIRLLPQLSVRENVRLGGLHGRLRRPLGMARMWAAGRGERRALIKRADECLDFAGVPARSRDMSPSVLAYGVQRRVEIARAICSGPRLLMLDEPAAGMNDDETAALGAMVRDLARRFGTTVVLVDHNLDLVFGFVDTLTAFDRGRRIAHGEPAAVRRDRGVIESYLGAE
jgi:branched-chain amino acid transport system ATP-binding protein